MGRAVSFAAGTLDVIRDDTTGHESAGQGAVPDSYEPSYLFVPSTSSLPSLRSSQVELSSTLEESASNIWAAQGQRHDLEGGAMAAESFRRTVSMRQESSGRLLRSEGRLSSRRLVKKGGTAQDQSEVLASYSPRILIEHLVSGPFCQEELTQESSPERLGFWGAVVFVDVSGFTKLSEALTKEHGAIVGSELLNVYINSFLEQLIDVVLASGGDIIKFAGDAMQCIWRVPDTTCSTRPEPPAAASAAASQGEPGRGSVDKASRSQASASKAAPSSSSSSSSSSAAVVGASATAGAGGAGGAGGATACGFLSSAASARLESAGCLAAAPPSAASAAAAPSSDASAAAAAPAAEVAAPVRVASDFGVDLHDVHTPEQEERFRRGEQGLPEQVLQAARCCMAMLSQFHGYSPTKGVSLALHMGIGAGFIDGFIVGGVQNKWEFFIAGEPTEQMSDAGEIATSGELALSARFLMGLVAFHGLPLVVHDLHRPSMAFHWPSMAFH